MKQTIIKDEHQEVAEHILRYLHVHPDAKDTLEGIVEWWLAEDKITHAIDQVSKALALLVERGDLVERKMLGTKTIYEVNTKKPT